MIKSIIKELAIIILLIIAIGLVFGIVFYDYNTMNITVPKKVEAYQLPSETQAELEETLEAYDTQELVKTYIVDGTDLQVYQSSNDYEKGKVNPFAKYTAPTTTDTEDGGTNSTNSSVDNTTSDNEDKGHFLNTVGK